MLAQCTDQRLHQAVIKLKPAGNRNTGHPLKGVLCSHVETGTDLEDEVIESMMMMIMIKIMTI